MSASRCHPFWVDSPRILVDHFYDFFPFSERARLCTTTALNSMTRFGVYLSILLTILHRSPIYMFLSLGIAVLAIAAYYGMKQRGILREGFENAVVGPTLFTAPGITPPSLVGGANVADKTVADVIGTTTRTNPTAANPYMNVLVSEILDNPTRPVAASVDTPEMIRTLSDEFQTRMYGDPDDVFQHNQNQRTWITQPSTSIPNDQESFQNWLFRVPGRTCKEGNNAACRTATEGGAVTWLSSP